MGGERVPSHDPDAGLPALVHRGLVRRVGPRGRPRSRAQVRGVRALDARPAGMVGNGALDLPALRRRALAARDAIRYTRIASYRDRARVAPGSGPEVRTPWSRTPSQQAR